MNYFNYAIKCVIRNIIYKLMKPKTLLIIIISLIIIFLLSQYTNVFGWEGDNTYTDKNNTIIIQYDSLNQDLLNRIKYFTGNSTNIENLIDDLRNNNYNYYCFYGSPNGSSMISSSYYATNDLYIYFYDRENFGNSVTIYDNYQGMTTNIRVIESGFGRAYVFTGNSVSSWTPQSFYIPTVLINYKSSIIYNYINSEDEEQTNSIIGAINNQTNSINQQTNTIHQQTQVIQETQDYISDNTVSDSSMSINTSSMSVNDNGTSNFFTNFLNNVYNVFISINGDSTVSTITIPLLPTGYSLTLSSDIISRYVINTPIYVIIQAFWWFILGSYIINFIFRMVKWLSDGEIAEHGIFGFINWLDNYNVIIKSYMM